MNQQNHLLTYQLVLTTRSPLHVGSGQIRQKTDYLFDPRKKTVRMLNMAAFFQSLAEKNLVDSYESFVLSGQENLLPFLESCGYTSEEIDQICLYSLDASDALDESHPLKEIHPFQRNAGDRAYIPGSGVKGAIRTVILNAMMDDAPKGSWPNTYDKKQSARQMAELEGVYLNTLHLKKDKNQRWVNDVVNSIMRGISISDSQPIPEKNMILTGKFDAGTQGNVTQLPLCRECIRPGTQIRFGLTIDQSVLGRDFQADTLMQYIQRFAEFYRKTYLPAFAKPRDAVSYSYDRCLILGGGAGYFSKNVAYAYLGAEDGADDSASVLNKEFPEHRHRYDIEQFGISPRKMKYARYQGKLYPYGLCEVQIK